MCINQDKLDDFRLLMQSMIPKYIKVEVSIKHLDDTNLLSTLVFPDNHKVSSNYAFTDASIDLNHNLAKFILQDILDNCIVSSNHHLELLKNIRDNL